MKPSTTVSKPSLFASVFCHLLLLLATLTAVSADTIFTVRQVFTVKDLPPGANQVRGWFWMPEDRPDQRILEFRVVEAPATMRLTRDPRYGRSWIYAESSAKDKPLRVVTEFIVLRKPVSVLADPTKTGPIIEEELRAFAQELNPHEKNMEVTAQVRKLADEIAGAETNPVTQANAFFRYVIDHSEHYSKHGASPKGLCLGSASECMVGAGDCCTDQHALFIALCRARHIPCRLMFGSRLKPENEGKDHDPGYRCWPNFYARGLGWVPVDVSSGDAAPAGRAGDWFGGLDENRLEWAEGRDFDLEPRSKVRPDLVIRGWVEVNGEPHKGLDRVVNFTRQSVPNVAATLSSNPSR